MDEEKKITIYEAEQQWYKIADTSDIHFGQYVKELESKGYKIVYSGDNE